MPKRLLLVQPVTNSTFDGKKRKGGIFGKFFSTKTAKDSQIENNSNSVLLPTDTIAPDATVMVNR